MRRIQGCSQASHVNCHLTSLDFIEAQLRSRLKRAQGTFAITILKGEVIQTKSDVRTSVFVAMLKRGYQEIYIEEKVLLGTLKIEQLSSPCRLHFVHSHVDYGRTYLIDSNQELSWDI